VTRALDEERERKQLVLFPIRIDDAVMDTTEQWAHDIRRTRHIGDFTRWKEHGAYQKALDRLCAPCGSRRRSRRHGPSPWPAGIGCIALRLRGEGRGSSTNNPYSRVPHFLPSNGEDRPSRGGLQILPARR
jgi:hypothetical protein